MATKIYAQEFEKEKGIELPDGTELILPQRTAEVYEKIVALEKERSRISEYEYCKSILEILYGKEGFKKIAPNGKKTNLDYLERVQIVSLGLLLSEKEEIEREQYEKQAEIFEPLTRRLDAINPLLKKL